MGSFIAGAVNMWLWAAWASRARRSSGLLIFAADVPDALTSSSSVRTVLAEA